MTTVDHGLARRMWHQLEPIHAVFWYAPEVFAEAAALGYQVTTRWPSYFAWRAAPLGTAGREHHGDGHITALLAADLDPCEALVSFAAIGAELTGPLLGAAFESGLLPRHSTLGIATVAFPAPR